MIPDSLGFIGKRIREYQILELIGKGGMGAVYRAQHVLLREDRAIKVVSRTPVDSQDFIERFIREARVLARLKDEHLVRLYEFWEDDGQLFMALEFLHGESVAARLLKRTRLTLPEALSITRQAAQGLKTAHEGQVVHRDISPDNLQLVRAADGSEVVKVMDFGIAKAVEEVQRELTANLFLGKFEYASPEQCGFGLEKGESIDWRSDVYSLGVTLFKMATGVLPFRAGSAHGYLLKHATEVPPAPSSVAPEARLPPELDRLVLRALSKRRTDRQQSMAHLIRELDAVPLPEPTVVPAATVVLPSTSRPEGATPSPSATAEGGATGKTGSLRIGAAFARKYVIKERLGEGGMGVVYRAVDTILNEPVALKVISGRFLESPDAVERLKREVVLARRVAHPNVCRIYDIGESDEGAHYVSMEYVEGRSLGHLLKEKGMLGFREGVPLVRQVLDALSAAHNANVIHRDLKPDNILVTPQGHAVILDFGLSLSEDSQRVTRAGFIIGTPHYMAPEQVTGWAVDTRCDLYAVGVILFRMFTGRLPFNSVNAHEVLAAHLKTPPPRPSESNPAISALLESIILKALEKEPAERFPTAEAFLAALDPVEPGQVRTSSESGRVIRVPSTGRARVVEGNLTETIPETADRKRPSGAGSGSDPARLKGVPSGTPAPIPTVASPTTVQPEGASVTVGMTEEAGAAAPPPGDRATPRYRPAGSAKPRPKAPRSTPWLTVGGLAALLVVVGVVWYILRPAPPPASEHATVEPSTSLPSVSSPTSAPLSTPSGGPGAQPPPIMASPVSTMPQAPPTTTTPASPPSTAAPAPPIKNATPRPSARLEPRPTAPSTVTTPPPSVPTAPPPPPSTLATPVVRPPATTLVAPPQNPAPPLSPEQGVRQALREYADAFSRLDKASVRRIFPSIPEQHFEGLSNFKAYEMQIAVTKVQVDLPRVLVECRIQHTYTSFSGKRESKTVKEKMVFIESRDAWVRIQ